MSSLQQRSGSASRSRWGRGSSSSSPQRVRPAHPRGGPASPHRQAGDADDGRPDDPVRGDHRLPAGEPFPAPVPDGALHHLGLWSDRFPRRLHQADAQAVARPARALEAGSARRRHGGCRARRAPPAPEHRRLHPGDRRHGAAVVRVVRVPLLRDRGGCERDEPGRRRRRATRGPGSSPSSRSWR